MLGQMGGPWSTALPMHFLSGEWVMGWMYSRKDLRTLIFKRIGFFF